MMTNTPATYSAVRCRALVRLLRFWWKGRAIETPWWSDTLTIVWTWQAVPLTTINKFIVATGKRKRGFVVRRESVWLTEPAYHDLNWYRQFMKRIRKCKSNV
jgi:hypothetical protein